jgi:hypothetical protein
MDTVVLIDPLEVPEGSEEEFLRRWDATVRRATPRCTACRGAWGATMTRSGPVRLPSSTTGAVR